MVRLATDGAGPVTPERGMIETLHRSGMKKEAARIPNSAVGIGLGGIAAVGLIAEFQYRGTCRSTQCERRIAVLAGGRDARADLDVDGTPAWQPAAAAVETTRAANGGRHARRSEERRVGKEWVSTGRSRWWPYQ